jgi:thiol-disulfide isomerase/thioredoxin
MSRKFLVHTMAIVVVMVICAKAQAMPEEGDVPPTYLGKLLNGDAVSLADYSGKAVVVSFWATWCKYCLDELPILENIQKAAGPDSMKVIAVNIESRDVFKYVTKKLKAMNIAFAYDPGAKAQTAYGVDGIPHMVIIGRDGKIVAVHRGYDKSAIPTIAAEINEALRAEIAAPAGQ